MTAIHWLSVAFGGAFGAVARVGIGTLISAYKPGLPLGTLLVNLLGSFLIGLAWRYAQTLQLDPVVTFFLVSGFLGAFTTFSAFSFDVLNLYQEGFLKLAMAYVFSSTIGGIFFAWLGYTIRID